MVILLLVVLAFALFFFPRMRLVVLHPFRSFLNGCIDLFHYVKDRAWNICPPGYITVYTGLFGKGKTLSMVHQLRRMYKKYQGKKCAIRSGKLLPNKIIFLSNIELKFADYVPFSSMQQFVDICQAVNAGTYPESDQYNFIIICAIDELNSIFNSREFKKNFNPQTLTSLMQIRKVNCQILGTAQLFNMVDLAFRNVTDIVIDCNKLWRLQKLTTYSAWDLENSTSPQYVKPIRTRAFFVDNADYRAYDTSKFASFIAKETQAGRIRSDVEMIAAVQPSQAESLNYNSAFFRKQKKLNKSS